VEVLRGASRDPDARRVALHGADAVVHLAAIVEDSACARSPDLAQEVNLEATTALIDDARAARVGHIVFTSTCSNYARMADPTVPIDERGDLCPVSLYAEQEVAIERTLPRGAREGAPGALGLQTERTVPAGIRKVVSALSVGVCPDPYDVAYRN